LHIEMVHCIVREVETSPCRINAYNVLSVQHRKVAGAPGDGSNWGDGWGGFCPAGKSQLGNDSWVHFSRRSRLLADSVCPNKKQPLFRARPAPWARQRTR
jgi:hypothetical protein